MKLNLKQKILISASTLIAVLFIISARFCWYDGMPVVSFAMLLGYLSTVVFILSNLCYYFQLRKKNAKTDTKTINAAVIVAVTFFMLDVTAGVFALRQDRLFESIAYFTGAASIFFFICFYVNIYRRL
ncbi:MAG: hypothetical protein AB7F23_09755 [Phycisphaerae bacterium]